jgi:hypothetical protein
LTRSASPKGKARSAREKKTLAVMVAMYCRAHHGQGKERCEDCDSLVGYAHERIDKCPFIDDKPTCLNCRIHCYVPSRRAQVRTIMRFSGPRMIYRHPVLAIRHVVDGRRSARSSSLGR